MAVVGRSVAGDRVRANVAHNSMEAMHSAFSRACEGRLGIACTLAISSHEKRLALSVE